MESKLPIINSREGKISGETPLAEISGRNFSDTALWVRRDVVGASLQDVGNVADAFRRGEVVPRLGVYTMSVLYPREIREAAKQAAQESAPGLQVSRAKTVEELKKIIPSSLNEPREASVDGLGQFHNKIGICVSYPEFEEERTLLTGGMDKILGIDFEWLEVDPHISIARGDIDDISNLEGIKDSLPKTIQLSPAQKLKD